MKVTLNASGALMQRLGLKWHPTGTALSSGVGYIFVHIGNGAYVWRIDPMALVK